MSFVLVYCFYVLVLGPAHYISYSYVYAESDIKHQQTDQPVLQLELYVSDLCVSGVAGSVATVLHDAIMTPADGMSLSLSLRFNDHFPGEPGLASVY